MYKTNLVNNNELLSLVPEKISLLKKQDVEIYFIYPKYDTCMFSIEISKENIKEFFLGNRTFFANLYKNLDDTEFNSSELKEFLNQYYFSGVNFKIVIATPKDTESCRDFLEVKENSFEFYITENKEFIFNVRFER